MEQLWYLALALVMAVAIAAAAWWLARQDWFYVFLARLNRLLRFPSAKNRRRAEIMRSPFPQEWLQYLHNNVHVYVRLSTEEQLLLQGLMQVVIAERDWEGCRGLEMTNEVKVTIAAQACLLLLGIEHDYFSNVTSILVYPTTFQMPEDHHGGGIVEGDSALLGQAWYRGPVILAWDDVLAGGRGEKAGHNVVYHEFAHQLDYLGDWDSESSNGRGRKRWRHWQRVMTAEYHQLVGAAERGEPSLLDKYGASSPAEFFAVATECFFEQPDLMQEYHLRLYEVLRDFYGQDPAARLAHR